MAPVDYRGGTALITGASSGIGAEFARRLAARGSDVVLVARREDRLTSLATELRASHGVTAWAVPFDLTQPAAGPALVEAVDALRAPVTSLVNNAGFGTAGPFHDADPERLRREIAVDVTSVVDLSRAFIGRLRAAGTGVLVNVASMAAYTPVPRMAVYAASKAFVLSFTEALWYESRDSGLRVMAVSPGATRTEFNAVVGTENATRGAAVQTPRQVVNATVRALDRQAPPSMIAGWRNRVAAAGGRLLPRRTAVLAAGVMTRGLAPDPM